MESNFQGISVSSQVYLTSALDSTELFRRLESNAQERHRKYGEKKFTEISQSASQACSCSINLLSLTG